MTGFNISRIHHVFTLFTVFIAFASTAQNQIFTLDDSLRGQITAQRSWWDVSYYHLNLNVDPEQRRLEGNVVVRYKVLKSDQILQVDLQPPLAIDSVLQDGRKLS
ncbi:MAG TPA: M1 family peptidase, partial [Chryseolinea sp.]|nr:M1 family peptidase [Chryseolinea sp.]